MPKMFIEKTFVGGYKLWNLIFFSQKFHAIMAFHAHLHDTVQRHVDSESMLEIRKQKETNWMLIGVCLSVGVLFAGICVAIAILIIIIIIRKRKGTGYKIRCLLVWCEFTFSGLGCNNQKQNEFEDCVTAVEHQEKDINMSKNVVYEQVKCHKQKIELQENVAYCGTSECVSSGIYNVVY